MSSFLRALSTVSSHYKILFGMPYFFFRECLIQQQNIGKHVYTIGKNVYTFLSCIIQNILLFQDYYKYAAERTKEESEAYNKYHREYKKKMRAQQREASRKRHGNYLTKTPSFPSKLLIFLLTSSIIIKFPSFECLSNVTCHVERAMKHHLFIHLKT